MNQQEANRRMEEEIQYFPWFVQNYFRKKSGDRSHTIQPAFILIRNILAQQAGV